MTIDNVHENHPDSDAPPRMLSVGFDVIPGNDPDAVNAVVDGLDRAYEELRFALLHQRSGAHAEAVREFWKRNRGHAFRAVVAVLVKEPDGG